MFRFADRTFDPDTGELHGAGTSTRLAPKPARLLAMLLDAEGELVEREQIRAQLWPDTNVDFDAGLHTCIRQIRTAVRQTGDDTECIETLPKRGYRIIAPTRRGEAAAGPTPRPTPANQPPGAAELIPYVVAFLLLAAITGFVLWGDPSAGAGGSAQPAPGAAGSGPARLAVVPFVDPASDANAAFNRDLTEAFITALVSAAPGELVVIGPSTTAPHFTDGSALAQVAAAVNADFVLHGGHRSSADIFFVEVVLPDGEHLFAQRMALDLESPAAAPADVVQAMVASILSVDRQ